MGIWIQKSKLTKYGLYLNPNTRNFIKIAVRTFEYYNKYIIDCKLSDDLFYDINADTIPDNINLYKFVKKINIRYLNIATGIIYLVILMQSN